MLLPLAQEALRNVKHIEETMSGLKGVLIGELPIACSTTVGKYILPRLVAKFRSKYPDVRVIVHVMSRRAAVEWLLGGRAEIVVVSAKPIHSEVEIAPFLEDQVILIVPPTIPGPTAGRCSRKTCSRFRSLCGRRRQALTRWWQRASPHTGSTSANSNRCFRWRMRRQSKCRWRPGSARR